MNISEEVRPGANRYVSGQGILQDLESYLASFNKLAIITGEKSFQVFQDFYPKDLSYPVFHYDGAFWKGRITGNLFYNKSRSLQRIPEI